MTSSASRRRGFDLPQDGDPSTSESEARMTVVGFVALGTLFASMYTIPILTVAMADEFRVPRSTLQGAFALCGFAIAFVSPFSGVMVDRCGLRRVLLTGMALAASSFIVLAVVQASWQVYATLIILSAPGHSLTYIGVMTAVGSVTRAKRGRALGISGAGVGVGLTLLLPVDVWSSTVIGWRGAYFCLGVAIGATGVAVAILMRRVTLVPLAHSSSTSQPVYILPPAVFPLLFVGGIAIGVMDEALYQHLVPYLTSIGFGASFTSLALSGLSLGYVAGQGLGGAASDHWGRRLIGLAGAGVFGLATLALSIGWGWAGLLLAVVVSGLGLGAVEAARSAVIADSFEGPSLGRSTGVFQWAYALGSAAIGWGGALLADALGGYAAILFLAVGAAVIWAGCLQMALNASDASRAARSA